MVSGGSILVMIFRFSRLLLFPSSSSYLFYAALLGPLFIPPQTVSACGVCACVCDSLNVEVGGQLAAEGRGFLMCYGVSSRASCMLAKPLPAEFHPQAKGH